MADHAAWIGRESRVTDIAAAGPVARLAATLDHGGAHWPKGVLPPLGHWLFHLPVEPQSNLGPDGHAARGDFLPPIAQPRRMWAGSRVQFLGPIPIGAVMEKRTTILAVTSKPGAAGEMVFVTLRHEIAVAGEPAVVEEQDLVYLDIAAPAPPRPVERPAAISERRLVADAALLFRFSALTFNSHRIHYDLAYTRDVEHYPGLVVHGPLQAMLLLDHAVREKPDAPLAAFAFRARSPLYADQPFSLCRAGPQLWTRGGNGAVTMTAEISPE